MLDALHDTGDPWLAAVLDRAGATGGTEAESAARDSASALGLDHAPLADDTAPGPVATVLPDEPDTAAGGTSSNGGAVSGIDSPPENARGVGEYGDLDGSGGEGRGPRSGALGHIGACIDWLEDPANAGDPRCQERQAVVLDMMDALEGWPQDTLQDRRTLLELAELNGAPPYPALGIRGGLESWRCFLASACSVEDLRACRRAWR
jgi:hypothetical protein